MSYNIETLPRYINTAGKITVITSLLGVVVFAVVFLLNLGVKEISHVIAQTSGLATTTVTVLNTPPQWTVDAQEVSESSTSTPTNSGDIVAWHATATDSNAEDYYLIICTGTSTPTVPTPGVNSEPSCANNQVQWAVSAAASSGARAYAATTTTESFAEANVWYAWICDRVTNNPRCNVSYKQGTNPTESPFFVNHRPTFTSVSTSTGALPGNGIVFTSVATDTDATTTTDTIQLWVCSTASFTATATDKCDATTLASSTLELGNPTATYTVPTPYPDAVYNAFVYLVDLHNHPALGGAQGTNPKIEVLNAPPTVSNAQITLNDGSDIVLTQNAASTTGFTLQYYVQDDNSCSTSAATSEVTDYIVSVFRSGIGTSTPSGCSGTTTALANSQYDPNNCYVSKATSPSWDIACSASSTSCTYNGTNDLDDEQIWDCTFSLWFVADPTEGGAASTSPYFAQDWQAAVSAIDDDGATTTVHTQSTMGQELKAFLYFSLDDLSIPYGELEPGDYSSPLAASTTIRSEGNIGLDESLEGEAMCAGYTTASNCSNSATSTIPESEQVFATSSVTYATASTALQFLSSSTPYSFDINVKKPTTTATTSFGITYWGIRVPGTITFAGSYTGENTFYGVASDGSQWY